MNTTATTTPRQSLPDEVWGWIEHHAPYDSADLMQRWLSGRPITEGQQRAIDEALAATQEKQT